MLADQLDYVVGVDPHRDSHALAVVDVRNGTVVFEANVAANSDGYRQAFVFGEEHAPGRRVFAVEGTGSFGAGLTRFLTGRGERVVEVGRLRRERRSGGKTDALDAVRAARSVLASERPATPRAGGSICDLWPDRCSAPVRALCPAGTAREVDAMAIGMLLAGEAITQDSYTGLTKKMFGSYPMPEDQSPEGLLLHTAGQSDQGWYVYDVWESKDHFQRFVQNKLGPAIKELGVGGDSQPQPQFFAVETLVKGPAL